MGWDRGEGEWVVVLSVRVVAYGMGWDGIGLDWIRKKKTTKKKVASAAVVSESESESVWLCFGNFGEGREQRNGCRS
ncbi:hypothetical protein COP2_002757 [Malus domestica]